MIDLHCHLLPGIDDGPATLDDALALARAMVADGITQAVATPHVFPGRFDNTRGSIAPVYAAFCQRLAQEGIALRLHVAGELRLSAELLDRLGSGELPFLNQDGSPPRAMLLEMPDGQVPLGTDRLCAAFTRQGIVPLIAHPERNRGVMERLDRLDPLLDAGCQLQLTAGSLLGDFGDRAHDTAWDLLERGQVAVVASDAHNLRGRAPRMSAARELLAQEFGEAVARRLTLEHPARLCGLSG
jgi:protein-tyrosine phosphatase